MVIGRDLPATDGLAPAGMADPPRHDRRLTPRPIQWLGPDSLLRFERADAHGWAQPLALGVSAVRDVLPLPALTPLPRAPVGVVGGFNLRGRVIVALDPLRPLGLDAAPVPPAMLIVVAHGPDLYGLLADTVTDVTDFSAAAFEPMPTTLPAGWTAVSEGVFRMSGQTIVVLSLPRLLNAIGGSTGQTVA